MLNSRITDVDEAKQLIILIIKYKTFTELEVLSRVSISSVESFIKF